MDTLWNPLVVPVAGWVTGGVTIDVIEPRRVSRE
jgi:hypothetical protein